jgi:hypothetical protein
LTGYIVAGLFAVLPLASIINFGHNFGEAFVALTKLKELGLTFDGNVLPPEEGSIGTAIRTAIKLLCGLYAPGAGRIFWQGEEVTDQNREAYR